MKTLTMTKSWLSRTTTRITTTLIFVASQRRNQGGVGSPEVMGNKWTIQSISQRHNYSLFAVQDLLFTELTFLAGLNIYLLNLFI